MSFPFSALSGRSYQAAQHVVPVINQIIGVPDSIVDLGGGVGAWCKAFKELGSKRVRCIDAPSTSMAELMIEASEFEPLDLEKDLPSVTPCDLSMSIEFAEHLSRSRSGAVVDFLTRSAPVVLFASAIPGQGGLGHINEQRPAFWKTLFDERGFQLVDAIRPRILFEESIFPWLRQNLYLYVERNALQGISIKEDCYQFLPEEFEIVETRILKRPLGLMQILTELPRAFSRSCRNRLRPR